MMNSQTMNYNHVQNFSSIDFTKEKILDELNNFSLKTNEFVKKKYRIESTLQMNEKANTQSTSFDSICDPKNENSHTFPLSKPNLRKLCKHTALGLGFNLNSKGTTLIIDAIIHLYENNIDTFKLEDLQNILSVKYSMELEKIKWNMNNAIKSMRRYSNHKLIESYLSEHDGRVPNVRYMIILFVYELRKKYPPIDYDNERIEKILYTI